MGHGHPVEKPLIKSLSLCNCCRQLVFCSLAVLAEERNPLECLDAFGATGRKSTVHKDKLIADDDDDIIAQVLLLIV